MVLEQRVRRLRRLGPQRRLAVRRAGRRRDAVCPDARPRRRRRGLQRRDERRPSTRSIAVARGEGIDADIVKGGVARRSPPTPPSIARLRAVARRRAALGPRTRRRAAARRRPSGGTRLRRRTARSARSAARTARGSSPRKLAPRAGRRRRALGVHDLRAHRRSPRSAPHAARTPHGTVARRLRRARHRGLHRRAAGPCDRAWLPMNSSMIVTEPLPARLWDEIGWEGRETARRHGARLHLRPAHRRRPDRDRRARRALPLRLAGPTTTRRTRRARTIDALSATLLHRLFPAVGA